MDLKETEILGEDIGRHWYYLAKARALRRYLGDTPVSSILDVGAGSGYFSRHLLAGTDARSACCVDTSYPADSDTTSAGKPLHFRRQADAAAADLVLMMDVLEHVDDDVGLLQSYAAQARPGCLFLLTVPAFAFLWSGHDVFLEHRRRYTLPQLEQVATRAGLRIRQGSYCFGLVFPLAVLVRLFGRDRLVPRSQLRRHHPVTNALLNTLCRLEEPLLRSNRLAGLSVFCLAEKP